MYSLYFLASLTTFYILYKNISRLFAPRLDKFEDLSLDLKDAYVYLIDITYDDLSREFIEGESEFDFILSREKPMKYINVNYSIGENSYSVLFNKDTIINLATSKFPFYDKFEKLPLYREVNYIALYVNDMEYNLTELFINLAGPKLNYHSDLVDIRFEEVVDHSGEFPELLGVTGTINIDDNLGNKHIYKYPGLFTWNENIIT